MYNITLTLPPDVITSIREYSQNGTGGFQDLFARLEAKINDNKINLDDTDVNDIKTRRFGSGGYQSCLREMYKLLEDIARDITS